MNGHEHEDRPVVSVVLPTMNEERAVGRVIEGVGETLSKLGLSYEVIVVDKSTDRTPEIARELGAIVVPQRERGYGDAYLTGFSVARGSYLVMMDPDGSYDPGDVPSLLRPLMEGKADIVIGNRLKGSMDDGAMPWLHRHVGNPFLTCILNRFFGAGVGDAHCGIRALRREVLERLSLKCRGMEFASEMVIEAAKRGLRIAEVPVRYHRRIGESKLSSFRDGWRHLRLMLLYSPLHLFLIPGIGFALFGLFLLSYTYVVSPIRVHTMILGSLMLILGFQIMSFGISAKVYAVKEGFEEPDRITSFFMRYSILEEGLVAGGVMVAVGIALGVRLFLQWRASGYGALFKVDEAVAVLTLMTIGFQLVFFSFFISMYMLKEG